MPSQLAHMPDCADAGRVSRPVNLHIGVKHHETRTGAVVVSITEQCPHCLRALCYSSDVVAIRNLMRHLRWAAVVDTSTWMHRQGLWGDQPLPGIS
jgi:hypothetical protein